MRAIAGAHVGRFLLSPCRRLGVPAWAVRQQWLLSISVALLLSLFTQIWWVKPATGLHCSAELFFSALSRPQSSLQQGRGQVNFTPCKITSPALKDVLTLTHSMTIFGDALWVWHPPPQRLCLRLRASLHPLGVQHRLSLMVELGDCGQLSPICSTITLQLQRLPEQLRTGTAGHVGCAATCFGFTSCAKTCPALGLWPCSCLG